MSFRILQAAPEPITIWAFLVPLIKALEGEGWEVEACCNAKQPGLLEEIQQKGIKINVLDIERSLNPIKIVRTYREYRRLFKEKKFDMVVAHTPKTGLICRLAAYMSGVQQIVYMVHALPYGFFCILEKLMGYLTDTVICVNEEDYEAAKKWRLTKHIYEIKGVGVDFEKYAKKEDDEKQIAEFKRKHGINPDNTVVAFAGRLVKQKGIRELLKAARTILNKRKDMTFLIAGSGPLEGYINSFIEKHNLQGNIKPIGFVKDMPLFMKAADTFVLPSYAEGLPVTVIEALATGIPVVATNIRGCRQLIRHGENGLLVERKNPNKLAEAIEKVCDGLDGFIENAEKAREKNARIYNVDAALKKQVEITAELLNYNRKYEGE